MSLDEHFAHMDHVRRSRSPSIESTDGFWIGRLSAAIGEAVRPKRDPEHVREDLRQTLAEFIASPVPSEELRVMLRRYLK